MDATGRNQRIAVGVFWLIVFLVVAYVMPRFVGTLLMLFSLIVFVVAVVGLAWPSLMRLPNRLPCGFSRCRSVCSWAAES